MPLNMPSVNTAVFKNCKKCRATAACVTACPAASSNNMQVPQTCGISRTSTKSGQGSSSHLSPTATSTVTPSDQKQPAMWLAKNQATQVGYLHVQMPPSNIPSIDTALFEDCKRCLGNVPKPGLPSCQSCIAAGAWDSGHLHVPPTSNPIVQHYPEGAKAITRVTRWCMVFHGVA
jgi:hypothetical protein